MNKITYIPGEIANAAIDEHGNRKPVTRTHHIFDDTLEKPQNEVNQDRIEDIAAEVQRAQGAESTLDGKIALEKQRAEGVESGLNNRLGTVEQLAEISIGGGDAQIATGADFTNPDATKRAKIPTVGAIVDGLNDGVYDVSKRNPTAGPNSDGKFTLEYILSNANTLIPTSWRHGGMSISFVSTYDNKYVQARCMSQNFTTDVTQWQGVDSKITPESKNLTESSAVDSNTMEVVYGAPVIIVNNYTNETTANTQCRSLLWRNDESPLAAGTKLLVRCHRTNGNEVDRWRIRYLKIDTTNIAYSEYYTLFDEWIEVVTPDEPTYKIQSNIVADYVLNNGSIEWDIRVVSAKSINDKIKGLENSKQDRLIIGTNLDASVEAESDNPITSGGVYKELYGETVVLADNLQEPVTQGTTTASNLYNGNVASGTVLKVKCSKSSNEVSQWRIKSRLMDDSFLYSDYYNTFDEFIKITIPANIKNIYSSIYSTYVINNGTITWNIKEDIGGFDDEKQDKLIFDEVPTNGSTNMVNSGTIYNAIKKLGDSLNGWVKYIGQLNASGIFKTSASGNYNIRRFYVFEVAVGDTVVLKANSVKNAQYAFLSSFSGQPNDGDSGNVVGSTGYTSVTLNTEVTVTVPDGAHYLYVYITNGTDNFFPVGLSATEKNLLPYQNQIDSKQDKLTFDVTPTKNSTNPVTSGGLFNLLEPEAILPEYVVNAAKDAYNRLQTWADGDEVFTLAQITDTHFDSYPVVANEIKYLSRLGNIFNFDTLVHSGDITLFHTDTFAGIREFEYFCTKGMDSKAPFFLTHGNHDGNQTVTMELSEVGNIFNYPLMKKGFDVTFGSDDKCYGYINFKYAKVRIYFLNTTENADGVGSSFGTTQAQWFANSLATVQVNWNIVVCAHICPYLPIKAGTSISGALIPILNAFVAKTSGTDSGVTFDFTNVPSSVKLAYTLYGHEHFNNYAKSNGVNYIIRQGYNNSASLGNVEDQTNLSMDEWNSTTQKKGEHCLFDIIAIKASGTGKVIRIGVGGSTRDFEFTF